MQLKLKFTTRSRGSNVKAENPEVKLYSLRDYISHRQEPDYITPSLKADKKYNISVSMEDLPDTETSVSLQLKLFIQDILIGYADTSLKSSSKSVEVRLITDPDKNENLQDPYKVLHECYGSVRFELTCYADGLEEKYFSEQVKISWDDRTERNIQRMLDYINSYKSDLLTIDFDPDNEKATGEYDAELLGESGTDLWSSNDHSEERKQWNKWSTYIQLAQEIIDVYEDAYGYFRTNPLTCIRKEASVSHIERLTSFAPSTLQYISLHPEELQPVAGCRGIHAQGRTYQPQKTMLLQNTRSRDTYENECVLGFLQTVIGQLSDIKGEMNRVSENKPEDFRMDSSWTDILAGVLSKVERLSHMYTDALRIPAAMMKSMPRNTDIFLSVNPYRVIFLEMKKWFEPKRYNLGSRELFIPITRISVLYERYFLTLLIRYFAAKSKMPVSYSSVSDGQRRGFRGYFGNRYEYRPPRVLDEAQSNWKYRNVEFNNTFHFILSDTETLILYFQPVIYNKFSLPSESTQEPRSCINGIDLCRNNSISYGKLTGMNEDINENGNFDKGMNNFSAKITEGAKNTKNQYYTPDYLIKLERKSCNYKGQPDKVICSYMIFDTKFKTREMVEQYDIRKLMYKYIISLSLIEEKPKQTDSAGQRRSDGRYPDAAASGYTDRELSESNSDVGNKKTVLINRRTSVTKTLSPVRLCLVYGRQNSGVRFNRGKSVAGSASPHGSCQTYAACRAKENYGVQSPDAYVQLLLVSASEGEDYGFEQLNQVLGPFLTGNS